MNQSYIAILGKALKLLLVYSCWEVVGTREFSQNTKLYLLGEMPSSEYENYLKSVLMKEIPIPKPLYTMLVSQKELKDLKNNPPYA